MISDSFFEMGSTHEVCEDYALHGENYAIVSDGCSNAGGPSINTDWGSRLLCKAAEEQIQQFDPQIMLPLISGRAKMLVSSMPNLEMSCLTATLMMLRVKDGNFNAFCVGDGVIGGKRKDGRWKIFVIRFPKGPFYLKYTMFDETQGFIDEFGPNYKIGSYFGKLENIDDSPEEEVMTYTEKDCVLDPAEPYNIFNFPIEEYDFAFVCSDGMESFYHPVRTPMKKANDPVSLLQAMRVVLDFVTIQPGFAKLQRRWAFRQDKTGTLIRRQWKNSDDVSVGIIHV